MSCGKPVCEKHAQQASAGVYLLGYVEAFVDELAAGPRAERVEHMAAQLREVAVDAAEKMDVTSREEVVQSRRQDAEEETP